MMFAISKFVLSSVKLLINRFKSNMILAYLIYWSKSCVEIVSISCGSLFVGYCASGHLVDHFNAFLWISILSTTI